jgi:hypothetical protein
MSAAVPAGDARGVPELQAPLSRAEADWAQAHAALHTPAHATHSLSAFHAALFQLRAVLEPVRETLYAYEDDADALYWAGATTNPAVQPVLALLRAHRQGADESLVCAAEPVTHADRAPPPSAACVMFSGKSSDGIFH